jgi:hypothetical protein
VGRRRTGVAAAAAKLAEILYAMRAKNSERTALSADRKRRDSNLHLFPRIQLPG